MHFGNRLQYDIGVAPPSGGGATSSSGGSNDGQAWYTTLFQNLGPALQGGSSLVAAFKGNNSQPTTNTYYTDPATGKNNTIWIILGVLLVVGLIAAFMFKAKTGK